MLRPRTRRRSRRTASATVEFAFVLPLLCLLFVIGVDFARCFYGSITIGNCAGNGALYNFDPVARDQSPYTTTELAAKADANGLDGVPTVTTTTGTLADGSATVKVALSYTFKTLVRWPGNPATTNITRSITIRPASRYPD